MINSIQVILTLGILVTALYAYQRVRSSYFDAILIFVLMITGIVFVFFPGFTNRIAHFLGVGRGADMVFYLGIVFFLFLLMKMYARIRRLEQALTELVRDKGIKNASSPGETDASTEL